MARASLETATWRAIATEVVSAFIVSRGGAVVWPEVEAFLVGGTWAAENTDLWDPQRKFAGVAERIDRIDPHHLTWARRALVELGILAPDRAVLQGREVTAWVHLPMRSEARETAVDRAAAGRRRTYRSYLAWTGSETCGSIAERVVDATLESLAGRHVWKDPARRGQVATLGGAQVPGGPLDHAGHWAIAADDPTRGFVPFAVEVKNLRDVVYPQHNEIWDLLAKLGAFPDRVPVFVTRRVHYWTYQLFAEIGAVAHQTRRQWFSPTIDADRFRNVTGELGFLDAIQVSRPDAPNRALETFLSTTLRKGTRGDSRQLMVRSAERWRRAAPVCAAYLDLRDDQLAPEDRHDRYRQFCEDLTEEGFDTSPFSRLE